MSNIGTAELGRFMNANTVRLNRVTKYLSLDELDDFYDLLREVYELGKQEGIKG